MAANTSLCNVFTSVINAASAVMCGANVSDVFGELIMFIRNKVTPEEFDAIHTALTNLECQVHPEDNDVRMVLRHSIVGKTPEGRMVITPTSEKAHDTLMEMGFTSHVESITYDANRSIPTIITHHLVEVDNVIPGPDSIDC